MKAYAILDGGGVKGAALAGCLKAAEELGIEIVGYGGTSAGGIIALLASVGFTGDELNRIMVEEVSFTDFLDDSGIALEEAKTFLKELSQTTSKIKWAFSYLKYQKLISRLISDFGLYNANKLQEFLLSKVKEKIPSLRNQTDITFDDLKTAGFPPLKIVASDLKLRAPVVYSAYGGKEMGGSAISAVRASMSYPFVFRPVKMNDHLLVDGGLSSNLPVFLFEQERRRDGLPVIAFNLVASPGPSVSEYKIKQFLGDMVSTTLESGEHLLQEIIDGVYNVSIVVPEGIDTIDFNLTKERRRELYTKGQADTHSYFSTIIPQWTQIENQVKRLQAMFVPHKRIVPVLKAIAREFEEISPATNIRTNIMLLTNRGTRVVVYHYGMDNDPDVDLELPVDVGCSGEAWVMRRLAYADLDAAKTQYTDWKLTKEQQNKIRADRRAMLSVPIFDVGRTTPGVQSVGDLNPIGVLSIDTDSSLTDTGWTTTHKGVVIRETKQWADILSEILT